MNTKLTPDEASALEDAVADFLDGTRWAIRWWADEDDWPETRLNKARALGHLKTALGKMPGLKRAKSLATDCEQLVLRLFTQGGYSPALAHARMNRMTKGAVCVNCGTRFPKANRTATALPCSMCDTPAIFGVDVLRDEIISAG